jgi:nucleoid-associated protein YgaU
MNIGRRQVVLHAERTPSARFALVRPLCAAAALALIGQAAWAQRAPNYPITDKQRSTARQVAEAGVPLSELSPNAPDSYTVKRGDTLWDISKLFLKSPWRWPELWGMNMDQIRNPHLIFPGQLLVLEKSDGRARLRMGGQGTGDTVKLSPRARPGGLDVLPIASIPMNLIGPFLNEAVIFETNELEKAPRIVATQEGRVMLSRGETAYVRGDLGLQRDWRVFRNPVALKDPATQEVLGYEAAYVGTMEYIRPGSEAQANDARPAEIVPATFTVTSARQEANVGDRLAPVEARDYAAFAPHAPSQPITGQIAALYGNALSAGQNQIVALNRGKRDGMERGHVLALITDGARTVDKTDPARPSLKLPNEEHGHLFVFRVFERMSYALIMTVQHPVAIGDRFTQP